MLMPTRTYPSARDRILDAAEIVLLREGVGRMGVEAVASEASVSKGGFFYHFPSKEQLLVALIERLAAGVSAAVAERAARDPDPHGRTLRATVEHAFSVPADEAARLQALVLALVEGAAQYPPLREAARANHAEQVQAAVAEGVPVGLAQLVHYALDGHWLGAALGTTSSAAGDRDTLRDELVALTRRKS
jgi:AcrR family transcriptional regulator